MIHVIMVQAFIMVKAATGDAEALSETLKDVEYVVTVNVVAGDFDLIIEADSEEVYDIINSVSTQIRELEAIEDTKTYICLE